MRCKACGPAVIFSEVCVFLRLIQSFAFDIRDVIHFLRFPFLRAEEMNLARIQGLHLTFNILIISILYFYRDVKLTFKNVRVSFVRAPPTSCELL